MWDGVGVESKIESVGEVCETEWPNVLKVSDANQEPCLKIIVIIGICETQCRNVQK